MSYEVNVLPVVVDDAPGASRVEFKVGVQTFHIGPDYFESADDAEWFAGQFKLALWTAGATAREIDAHG